MGGLTFAQIGLAARATSAPVQASSQLSSIFQRKSQTNSTVGNTSLEDPNVRHISNSDILRFESCLGCLSIISKSLYNSRSSFSKSLLLGYLPLAYFTYAYLNHILSFLPYRTLPFVTLLNPIWVYIAGYRGFFVRSSPVESICVARAFLFFFFSLATLWRTVQVLLDHGADIDLAERANGRKALHLAVNTSNVLCVNALLEHMKKEQEGVVTLMYFWSIYIYITLYLILWDE